MKIPFITPKEPTQLDLIKQEQKFSHNENLFTNVMHPQANDEAAYAQKQEQRDVLIQWQQDLSPEIKNFVHKVKRELNVGDQWVPHPNLPPLANEQCIFDTVGLIELSTNKNLMNSNYSESRVLIALKHTVFDYRCTLLENREIYNISKSDMPLIVRLFKNAIEPTYWRCLNNGERKYAGDINKSIEVRSDNQQPQRKGLFGMGG